MEQKNIIIILIIIIVILAASMIVMSLPSTNAQKACKITITSNDTLYEGENITVSLKTVDGNPIADETVNITINSEDGSKDLKSVVTDENGTGRLKLDKLVGNYTVNCSFAGNANYTANSTVQKLTIKKEVVEQPVQQTSAATSQKSSYPSGLTDDEIDAYIQRDLNERAKNGVDGAYDYEGAKQFYRNVPPEGMK